MTRHLASFFVFLTLALVQTSFFASLPSPLSLTPLVFAGGVYALQHLGAKDGAWWLVGIGLFLDLFRIGTMPGETVAYALAALAAIWLSGHVFSNRSLYGMIGCAFLSLSVLHLARAGILALVNLSDPSVVPWSLFLSFAAWQYVLVGALMVILFSLSKRMKKALKRVLILPSRETL